MKNFEAGFKKAVDKWIQQMNQATPGSVPVWFANYLKETRSHIEPQEKRMSVKVKSWQGHTFDEIEALLHAMHISIAGTLFNSILSKETGYMMMHKCGCDDCFYEGDVVMKFPDIEFITRDFISHQEQEANARKVA